MPRFVLAARKSTAAPRPVHRIAPPPGHLLDRNPFRRAVERGDAAIRFATDALCSLFAGRLGRDSVREELVGYLIDRLLMDGLATFRSDPGDAAEGCFAAAVDRALDHALVAVLTRRAGWTSDDFANAEPDRLCSILGGCVADLRRGFRQPADGRWMGKVDWGNLGARVMTVVLGHAGDRRGRAVADRLSRALVADRLRLGAVGLLARTADPLTGSVVQEYAEAALDRLEEEVRYAAGRAIDTRHLMCREELVRLVEDIEAKMARGTGAPGWR